MTPREMRTGSSPCGRSDHDTTRHAYSPISFWPKLLSAHSKLQGMTRQRLASKKKMYSLQPFFHIPPWIPVPANIPKERNLHTQ
jgi:hypothetical protein